MNILICSEYFYPSTGGAQKVVKELAISLLKYNQNVTVATSFIQSRKKLKGINLKEFKISGNVVNGIKGNTIEYIEFLRSSKYDVIIFYAAQQWTFDLALDLLNSIKSRLIFCPCGFSNLYKISYRKYYNNLAKKLKFFEKCIYHSYVYQDFLFGQKYSPNNSYVIENAASDEFLSVIKNNFKQKYQIDGFTILNVSNYSFNKGQHTAIILFLLSKIKGNLVLIGNLELRFAEFYYSLLKAISKLANCIFSSKKIYLLKNLSRKDVIDSFIDADIFLFTSKIECSPLVLFESCAAQTPFISINVGNSDEIVKWTQGGMSSSKSLNLIQYLNLLYLDKNKRLSLARSGRLSYLDKYNWHKIMDKYFKVIKN